MRAYQVELAGGGVPLSEEQVAAIALPDANGFPFLWEAWPDGSCGPIPALSTEDGRRHYGTGSDTA